MLLFLATTSIGLVLMIVCYCVCDYIHIISFPCVASYY